MRFPSRFLIPLFAGAGALHFAKPAPFDGIVPPQLPGRPRTYTYASGAAEIAAATLLAAPWLGPRNHAGHRRRSRKMQRFGGLFAAVLLAAVWPANFYMAWQWRDQPPAKRALAIGRLPLQLPLIGAARRVHKEGRLD
ncbi:hypothetical protein JKI95_04200 [Corynebacterium aquatimens]|uniref:DoxX family protein n=1 Tax=Corynebacterium TaxID=1716 RepID=UPI001F2CE127|nr:MULTISPECIES: hypothetical protein [Corynebacterium]QYH20166.1 hypothetical protein JKI95_04200 [Corynebacterium aquatimens]UIZ92595.1 hypothetical protein JZY91_01990 [Corynebacterium sp. CNCTC7651]